MDRGQLAMRTLRSFCAELLSQGCSSGTSYDDHSELSRASGACPDSRERAAWRNHDGCDLMDLRLYSRVLWRFRLIVMVGFVLALALTLLTVARVSFKNGRPSVSYRQQETWQSTTRIFVTQGGNPLVRSVNTQFIPVGPQTNGTSNFVPVLGDPNRFASYATLYANLAMSDAVRRFMLQKGPVPGAVQATTEQLPGVGTPLPFLSVSGVATTPEAALITARRATDALISYVKKQQDELKLPADQRVVLQVLNRPAGAGLATARSKTRPVVVFLAAMMAVIGLVFVLENLRPRLRPLESELGVQRPVDATRRSA